MVSGRMQRCVVTFVRVYTKGLEVLIGVLLAEMILVGFAAVVVRYLLSSLVSLYWAEEVIRYSFIWSVFLVSPLVIRRGAHLALDICIQRLPPPIRRLVGWINTAVILAFLLVLTVQGIGMVRMNLDQLSSALEISMAWIYLAVPVGGVLMLGEYLGMVVSGRQGDTETATRAGPVAVE